MAKRKEQQLESTSLFLTMDNFPTDVVQSKYFRAMLKSYDTNADPPPINKVKDIESWKATRTGRLSWLLHMVAL
jgi:hypothetical protein